MYVCSRQCDLNDLDVADVARNAFTIDFYTAPDDECVVSAMPGHILV